MTILEKLLERAEMKDLRLNRELPNCPLFPKVFATASYYSTNLHSFVSSQSSTVFTFTIPWDMLENEDLIEEKIIDLSKGRNSISLRECSENFQNEVLKRMIAEKHPDETLFVEKYAGDGYWLQKTVIPAVTCLEELEIMLDLENR